MQYRNTPGVRAAQHLADTPEKVNQRRLKDGVGIAQLFHADDLQYLRHAVIGNRAGKIQYK